MLITSLTTAAAFLATAFSPLLDVSTFGLYTACLVVSNYISVITYYIGVVMFFHLYFEYVYSNSELDHVRIRSARCVCRTSGPAVTLQLIFFRYGCCCFNRWRTAIPERKCCECLVQNRRRQLEMRLEDELYATYVAQVSEVDHSDEAEDAGANGNGPDQDVETGAKEEVAIASVEMSGSEIQKKEASDSKEALKRTESGGRLLEHHARGSIVGVAQLDTKAPSMPVLENFCGNKFFCVINASYNRFIFPAILFGLTIGMAYCASQLGPTTQVHPCANVASSCQ